MWEGCHINQQQHHSRPLLWSHSTVFYAPTLALLYGTWMLISMPHGDKLLLPFNKIGMAVSSNEKLSSVDIILHHLIPIVWPNFGCERLENDREVDAIACILYRPGEHIEGGYQPTIDIHNSVEM